MSSAPRCASHRGRSLSRGRAWLFRGIVLLVAAVVLETGSTIAITFLYGSLAAPAAERDKLAQQDAVHLVDDLRRPLMVHPYLGTVLQPDPEAKPVPEGTYRTTEYGFRDTASPVRKRSPDKLIVVILGGSVARQFAWYGSETLARRLAEIPGFSGRSIDFVRIATDGHKQPQQLMALSWLLALGGEFDVVINLDGLNESALPKIDNWPLGMRADYPRQWGSVVAQARNVEFVRRVGYLTYLRDRQRSVAATFASGPWRSSPTGLLLWHVISQKQEDGIREQQKELGKMTHQDLTYGVSGAPESFASDEQFFRHCVEIWARCSIQLHHLCEANGARYFHFLQPNQYVEPLSKPMPPEEQPMRSDASPFRVPVGVCYPLMRSSAARLAREGVSFCDLSQVFAEHPEPIYVDDCCHITHSGDEIMAEAVGDWIARHSGPTRDGRGTLAGPRPNPSD